MLIKDQFVNVVYLYFKNVISYTHRTLSVNCKGKCDIAKRIDQ